MSDTGYTDGGINPYYIGDCKYCAAKIALIDDAQGQEKIAQEVAWDLEKRIAELESESANYVLEIEKLADENKALKQRILELEGNEQSYINKAEQDDATIATLKYKEASFNKNGVFKKL
jgi:hypothetical protein